jgi:hypothetical protein
MYTKGTKPITICSPTTGVNPFDSKGKKVKNGDVSKLTYQYSNQ